MSGYLRNIVHKQEFDGDEVVLTMTPVTLGETLSMQGKVTETEVAEALVPMVERHLVTLSGLKAADGTDVSKEEFLRSAYFTRLVVAAGVELLTNANPRNPKSPAP